MSRLTMIALGSVGTFAATAVMTGWIRKWALQHELLALPTDRGSHTTPTPLGGGVAIALVVLCSVALLQVAGDLPPILTTVLLLGGGTVAVVGFIDDNFHVAVTTRLTVHFLAVAGSVWALGRLPPIDFGIIIWDFGFFGYLVSTVVLVWFLNLFNFMDGIDGIAGAEAVTVTIIATALLATRTADSPAIAVLMLAASSVGGFLVWNWPPARIFMGDAGSGFLGFTLGLVAWYTIVSREMTLWVWLILFAAFFADATLTLLRRWSGGQRVSVAHRSHAYQRLSRKLGSHGKVSSGLIAINFFWLAPWAWLAAFRPSLGGFLFLAAYIPLIILAWRCGAGLPDD